MYPIDFNFDILSRMSLFTKSIWAINQLHTEIYFNVNFNTLTRHLPILNINFDVLSLSKKKYPQLIEPVEGKKMVLRNLSELL